MRRKILSLLLALTLCIGLAAPALAASEYDYESFTVTDTYGPNKTVCASYTFEQAATGYLISYRGLMEAGYPPELIVDPQVITQPCVILKDNSRVTVELADNFAWSGVPSGYSGDFSKILLWHSDEQGAVLHYSGEKIPVTSGTYTARQLFERADDPSLVLLSCGLNNVRFVLESQVKYFDIVAEEPEKEPITFQFGDEYSDTDYGPTNSITFTNNTDAHITGAYTLLFYAPKAQCNACLGRPTTEHDEQISARLYSVDIDLAPGESVTKTAYFGTRYNLTTVKYVWVEYDDAAERAAYLAKDGAVPDVSQEVSDEYGFLSFWYVDADYLAQSPYNITFAPMDHK